MWRTKWLLGKDLERNKTAAATEHRGKHASTTVDLVLETVYATRCHAAALYYNNGIGSVFYVVFAAELSRR
jgi:hypothetical protein